MKGIQYVVSHSVVSNSCNALDCSPPGSTAHAMFQARILEWVVISSSRGSSQLRDWTHVSCIADWFFTTEASEKPYWVCVYINFFCMWMTNCSSTIYWKEYLFSFVKDYFLLVCTRTLCCSTDLFVSSFANTTSLCWLLKLYRMSWSWLVSLLTLFFFFNFVLAVLILFPLYKL